MASQNRTKGEWCEYCVYIFLRDFPFLLTHGHYLLRDNRCITVNYRQPKGAKDELEFIPDYHRAYDPLQYPCIFPDGQDGWHCELNHTCLQHVNYQLMDRGEKDTEEEVINPILRGRTLGQQYLVDQFAKTEFSRLNYISPSPEGIAGRGLFGGKGCHEEVRWGPRGYRECWKESDTSVIVCRR